MRPVLFRWRNLNVQSYPAMLYLGLVFGVVAGNIAAHVACIDPLRSYIATLVLIIPALVGGRLLFVATHWNVYRRDPSRIWNRRSSRTTISFATLVNCWPNESREADVRKELTPASVTKPTTKGKK